MDRGLYGVGGGVIGLLDGSSVISEREPNTENQNKRKHNTARKQLRIHYIPLITGNSSLSLPFIVCGFVIAVNCAVSILPFCFDKNVNQMCSFVCEARKVNSRRLFAFFSSRRLKDF